MSPILGIIASSKLVASSSYESIASFNPTSGASITFSSIPSTYQHLQIRGMARDSGMGGADLLTFRFNGDGNTNYSYHLLKGTGSSATATGASTMNSPQTGANSASNNAANIFGVFIIDIHDYASTTKNKTVRSFGGSDSNSSDGLIALSSGLWRSTATVSSITIYAPNAGFVTGSTFSLYGIKGA